MADNLSTVSTNFTLEEYQAAAEEWRDSLLMIPVQSCMDQLRFMNPIPGVHGTTHVGAVTSKASFAPYNPSRTNKSSVEVKYRPLTTYLGSLVEEFEPNAYILSLLGRGAAFQGDAQKEAPSAKLVLSAVARAAGESLGDVLFSAKRNADGDSATDLFDGWGTIADKEIADGNISTDKQNLLEIGDFKTDTVKIAKEIERAAHPALRAQNKFLYCSQEFADAYCDDYLLTHQGINYNTQFDQAFVEGSGHKTTLVPLPSLAGSDKLFLAPASNMLFGYDNLADETSLEVMRNRPFVLTFAAAMFFGTQFNTLDPRQLLVVKVSE